MKPAVISAAAETHTHSAYSDGKCDEIEFVSFLKGYLDQGNELELVALTDHNTLNGWEPLKRAVRSQWGRTGPPFRLVAGIELAVGGYEGIQTDLLVYLRNEPDPERCNRAIQPVATQSIEANCPAALPLVLGMEHIFHSLGIDYGKHVPAWGDVEKAENAVRRLLDAREQELRAGKPNDSFVWRVPLTTALRRQAFVDLYGLPVEVTRLLNGRSPLKEHLLAESEKFFKSLSPGLTRPEIEAVVDPLYGMLTDRKEEQVGRYPDIFRAARYPERLDDFPQMTDALSAAKEVDGLPVLAHPIETYLKLDGISEAGVLDYLLALKDRGLAGVECNYPGQDRSTIDRLVTFCREHGLVVFGGSDFHGKGRDRANFAKFSTAESVALFDAGSHHG